ncbi:MAG: hypothetical protein M5R40_22215 [Anaerolineae bacterium]|nr:hypothetical protein [Anaerolineae bacterium]
MDSSLFMVAVGVAVALIGGYFVARASEKAAPVQGGAPARALNYVASAGMSGIPAALLVTLVVTIFTPANLLADFVKYVLVSLVIVVGALLLFAAVEPDLPATPEQDALPPLD